MEIRGEGEFSNVSFRLISDEDLRGVRTALVELRSVSSDYCRLTA